MNLKSETMSNDSTHISDTVEKHFFRASAADFKKIPGSPIAYWVSDIITNSFEKNQPLGKFLDIKAGMSTTDNQLFLRQWYEVDKSDFQSYSSTRSQAQKSQKRWFPYIKGGSFRRWYGNNDYVVNWKNDGEDIKQYIAERPEKQVGGRLVNMEFFFRECLAWTRISSGSFSSRYYHEGSIFSDASNGGFGKHDNIESSLLLVNSKIVSSILAVISPTLNFYAGDIAKLPAKIEFMDNAVFLSLYKISREDWDACETSWDFTNLPLLGEQAVGRVSDSVTRYPDDVGLRDKAAKPTYPLPLSIKETYTQLRAHWQEMTMEMQRLEQENNRIFIDAYGLQDELTPDVPLNEITLTCNPHYRYGNNKTDTELDALLLADTLKEFISYAVGCMFGRYALDKPGLILANQGETLADYLKQIPEPIFSADDDNVIPMLDGDWFTDDVTERFGKFLKVTFGEAHYEENLKYIEQALGKDIRKYFLKDFYNDHLKRYKKRPIYWLFSSPKGTFNALIYLHRYRSDTVSVVLNDYLREFRAKLSAHKVHLEAVSISSSASASEKTKALKNIENHRKMLDELDTYEREVLYPLATEQLEIDLDDGVKVNYQKFGEALKKIPGLAAKED